MPDSANNQQGLTCAVLTTSKGLCYMPDSANNWQGLCYMTDSANAWQGLDHYNSI